MNDFALEQRMMIGDSIHRGGRDVDEALDLLLERDLDHRARALDVGALDFFGGVERQRGGGVHHHLCAFHGFCDLRSIADVPRHLADFRALGVVEREQVERGHLVPASEQMTREVDAEEAGAAGHENSHGMSLQWQAAWRN